MHSRRASRHIVRSSQPITALRAFPTALLAILLAGCGSVAANSPTNGADRPSLTATSHPSVTTAQECAAAVLFEASNSGIADRELASLARRLRTTAPTITVPTSGQLVSLESALPGTGHVSYQAKWSGQTWRLSAVQICPGPQFAKSCGRSVEHHGHPYRLEPPQPVGVTYGVASPLGAGWALGCAPKRVGPIGVYGASEQPASEAVTATWNGSVHMYAASR